MNHIIRTLRHTNQMLITMTPERKYFFIYKFPLKRHLCTIDSILPLLKQLKTPISVLTSSTTNNRAQLFTLFCLQTSFSGWVAVEVKIIDSNDGTV